MTRGHIRRILVLVVGLIYSALVWPLGSDLWHSHWLVGMQGNDCEPMFLSFLVGLGFFLLLAVRKPSEHRSLIIFAAWNSLFHASVMAVETVEAWSHGVHRDYTDVVISLGIGGVLLAAIPAKEPRSGLSDEWDLRCPFSRFLSLGRGSPAGSNTSNLKTRWRSWSG